MKRNGFASTMEVINFICRGVRGNEVFEVDDLESLVDRGNRFFGLLPIPSENIPLSKCSPFSE